MKLLKEARREVDPMDPRVRTAADGILERVALNNLGILGAEKRVLADGRVQYRAVESQRWVTVGRA